MIFDEFYQRREHVFVNQKTPIAHFESVDDIFFRDTRTKLIDHKLGNRTIPFFALVEWERVARALFALLHPVSSPPLRNLIFEFYK
jgi:hypothetical protein